jgi:head-tail adaptor
MAYPAGKRRHHISIDRPLESHETVYGSKDTTKWTLVASRFASIDSIAQASAREFSIAKTFAATVSHVLVTNYLPGVKPTHRIRFGARVYYINGVVNVREENRDMILYATEIIEPS